jgi:hypothetical protein
MDEETQFAPESFGQLSPDQREFVVRNAVDRGLPQRDPQ